MDAIILIVAVIAGILIGIENSKSGNNESKKKTNIDTFNTLFGTKKTKKDDLSWTGLEEWEKDKVRKGEADVWSFEEEDLEDDDYYFEDDE